MPSDTAARVSHPAADIPSIQPAVVMLSGRAFVLGCADRRRSGAGWPDASRRFRCGCSPCEVFATILGLFLFGSFKIPDPQERAHLRHGAGHRGDLLRPARRRSGIGRSPTAGWWAWAREHLLSFRGLDDLIHADTMLFILGLTFFVSVIAQTRMLEGITLFLLRRNDGAILPTVMSVTAVVACVSGILDGVSMIGLTIRTLVIILMLGAAPRRVDRVRRDDLHDRHDGVRRVAGVRRAAEPDHEGEPPSVPGRHVLPALLRSDRHRHLSGRCQAPAQAAGGPAHRPRADGRLDANAEDVRFLQATRHGEVLTPVELVEAHADVPGRARRGRARAAAERGVARLGARPGRRAAGNPEELLGHYVSEELAHSLDRHYVLDAAGDDEGAMLAEQWVDDTLAATARTRRRAQLIGALALIPFVGLLIVHGIYHQVPLFLASFAGFAVALLGIAAIPKMRALALREARHEYAEYYFLFPLFLSITLLTQARFFDGLQTLIADGLADAGRASGRVGAVPGRHVPLGHSRQQHRRRLRVARADEPRSVDVLHLFAMAQIAGYALGGCWTHIGSAQSVVAYAFIQRDVDAHYTPMQWIREMTPVILEMLVVISILIWAESQLLAWLG